MNLQGKNLAWIVGPAALGLVACGVSDESSFESDRTDEAGEALRHRGGPGRGHGHGARGHGHGARGHGHGARGHGHGGSVGTGGTSGSAGTETGGASGTSGTAGTGGSGGAVGDLVGALDGRLMQFPCADTPVTDDCSGLGYVVDGVVTACVAGRSEMVLDHPIGGTRGARYAVTMHFYGIMEPKVLGGGVTREAGSSFSNRDGGAPLPWATAPAGTAYPLSTYSAYEMHVLDDSGLEIARYFLNSDVAEGHWTFVIDFEKTIDVVGGGSVRLRRLDSNCRLIKNCGATPGIPCDAKARTVDLGDADPPPPAPGPFEDGGFNQPGLNMSAGHAGQWWMIDVTAVEAR
ncbi:MAG TPA: hypothetical protein VFZ53_27925 [Polyangiaceae bacterium]